MDSTPTPLSRGALLALGLLTLIWSTNWIVMKLAMLDSGPFDFSALRYGGGTLVLFVMLRLRGESLAPPPLQPTLLIGITQTAGFTAFAQWALVRGGAGSTALLVYTMPFWTVLLAWLALGETLAVRQRWALLLAASGLLAILHPWSGAVEFGSAALAVASGVSWACSVVLAKRLFARPGLGLTPLRLTAWQMLLGSALLVVLALLVPQKPLHWTPNLIGALLYNIVLATGVGWTLWLGVVQKLPASVAGLSSLAVPLTGVLIAWAWLGERPGAAEAGGIALIACGLLLLLRAPARRA